MNGWLVLLIAQILMRDTMINTHRLSSQDGVGGKKASTKTEMTIIQKQHTK
jgi:hypothetical protein